jgi:hypothetical protein
MDVNDLPDRIMKIIHQLADEIAEQRLQVKIQETGRGPGGRDPFQAAGSRELPHHSYRMNSNSRYLGSGQSSSATTVSSWSTSTRTASISGRIS